MNKALCLLFLFLSLSCERKAGTAPKGPPQRQEAGLPVGVVELQRKKVSLSSALFGKVKSTNVAEIRPQVSGIIQDRLFEEGSFVQKGQQLYQIDPSRYQADLELAKAQLESAEAGLFSKKNLMDRYRKLLKSNAVSKQEFENAEARHKEALALVSMAKARVERARIDLAYTKVYSPISGYVGKTLITEGGLVTANQPKALAVVRSLDPVYVDISFPAAEALELRRRLGKYLVEQEKGNKLTVSLVLEKLTETYRHKGELVARELSVDEQTGTVALRALVPNPELLLLPGMFVTAYVDQLGFGEKVLVPQRAVIRDQNGDASVWIVSEEGKIERRPIETSVMYQGSWVIEEGVRAGELVAVDNLQKLNPGMQVEPLAHEKQAERARGD